MAATRRDGEMSEVGGAITGYLKSHGLMKASRECLVGVVWSEVVGQWYAQHTQVLRLERGVLSVRCDSPARAQQLQLDSAHIIEALAERVGRGVVKEIRPTSAGLSRARDLMGEAAGPRVPVAGRGVVRDVALAPAEQEWVVATAAGIEEPGLRARVMEVLASQCKANRWKRDHGYVPCSSCGGLIPPGRGMCMGCDPGREPMQGSPDGAIRPWKSEDWA